MNRSKQFILFMFILLSMCAFCLSCSTRGKQPSVVLIIIDTLRADHLSCYGYSRNTSPVIDSLAGSGIMMKNACSQAAWTLPATTSIMSGLSSRSHGAGMDVRTGRVFGLDPGMPLIATIMNGNGYATAGFFNVYLLGSDFGFHRGFEAFSCRDNGDGFARQTVDAAVAWLEDAGGDKPFFLAVHFFDVHDPYDPPDPYDRYFTADGLQGDTFWEFTPDGAVKNQERLDYLMGLYDGEIAYVDHELGRLFSSLRRLGLSDNTLVILTADHGEEFLEHGYVGHGRTFYPEIVHVPLIFSGSGIENGVGVSSACGQFDILPTILDYCDLPSPEWQDGVSLFDTDARDNRVIPSSGINTGEDFEQVSIRNIDELLIWNAETDELEMYDLRTDPMAREPAAQPDSDMIERALYYWSTPCHWNPVLLEDWQVAPILHDLGYVK